jgi:hypothetical protein
MAIRKKDDGETPEKYFWRVYQAKRDNEKWAAKIPCDSIVHMAVTGQEGKLIKIFEQQRKKCYGEEKK